MPVSIYDIAKRANVSAATVSRALNDNPRIGKETRKRVKQLAAEMGYVPSAVARSLTSEMTRTIGVIITALNDPFMGHVMEGIEHVAHATSYDVFLGLSHNNPKKELAVAHSLQQRRVDGLIVFSAHIASSYEHFRDTLKIPIVVINLQEEIEGICSVGINDFVAAQAAVNHLIELNHQRIGFITTGNRPVSSQRRYNGYVDAMAKAGLPVLEPIEIVDERHIEGGYKSLEQILENKLTAVFCYNDSTAIGLLSGCYKQGIRVPQDLSIIGFDDIEAAAFSSPALTTINQPKLELGLMATNTLIGILDGDPIENIVIDTELVIRQSTAPLVV